MPKPTRGRLHALIKTHFPYLVSNFINGEGGAGGSIGITTASAAATIGPKRARGGPGSFSDKFFTYFYLEKENMDTMQAINLLCSKLNGMSKSCFGFAGTKDKRAVTTQLMSAFRLQPQRLMQAAASVRGIRVQVVQPTAERGQCELKLGELQGNRFRLVLRSLNCSQTAAAAALRSLRQKGFINYFGLQRFGRAGGGSNVSIGIKLLRLEHEAAVEDIMQVKDGEKIDIIAARNIWLKEGNASRAYDELPNHMMVEKAVMGALSRRGLSKDWAGAIAAVPRAMRTMYTHAVQSLVFNRCLSYRLSLPNSAAVMIGDLVGAGAGEADDGEERGPGDVVEVTADNISQYSLADVVLPLPGKDVRYPCNGTGDEYNRVLAELNLENAFTGSHVKELNLSGAYRKIVCLPQGDVTTLFDVRRVAFDTQYDV
jgi:tRNA pseudouridine13 synthase